MSFQSQRLAAYALNSLFLLVTTTFSWQLPLSSVSCPFCSPQRVTKVQGIPRGTGDGNQWHIELFMAPVAGADEGDDQDTTARQRIPESIEPPLLIDSSNGREISTVEQWETRREELLESFRTHVYGRVPSSVPFEFSSRVTIQTTKALDGRATLKHVELTIQTSQGRLTFPVQLLVPNRKKRRGRVPVIVLICNTCRPGGRVNALRPDPFWPTDTIVEAGFATAAFYNGDVDPDDGKDDFRNGIHPLFDDPAGRPDDAWGAVAAWAWGASRVVDYLESDADIEADKVVMVGHSRGGKTALWAAANDPRIQMVVSNNSGNTGAALSRHRAVGRETVAQINTAFPHWFCRNYHRYNNDDWEHARLPLDQHMLLASVAPRALYVASATGDAWADPLGEFLATQEAAKIWSKFYGMMNWDDNGQKSSQTTPPANDPIQWSNLVRYHIREGDHDLTLYDWQQYLVMARKVIHMLC